MAETDPAPALLPPPAQPAPPSPRRVTSGVKWLRDTALSENGVITFAFILCAAAVLWRCNSYVVEMKGEAEKALDAQPRLAGFATTRPVGPAYAEYNLSDGQYRRLIEQLTEIRGRQRFHFEAMARFYQHHYAALTLASTFAVVAAVALVFISRTGWQGAQGYTVTVFVIAAAMGALFAAWPALFRLEDNLTDNKKLFIAYTSLGGEVCTYLVTDGGYDGATTAPPSTPPPVTTEDPSPTSLRPRAFIRYVDQTMARLCEVPIGFDTSKIPTYAEVARAITAPAREADEPLPSQAPGRPAGPKPAPAPAPAPAPSPGP